MWVIGWMHVDAFGCITWIERRGNPVAVSVRVEMRDLESKVNVVVGELDWMVITMATAMAMAIPGT